MSVTEDENPVFKRRKPSCTSLQSELSIDINEVEYANCRMEQLPCFHEETSRNKSAVLLENAGEGCYLIRTSTEVGNYSLSVRTTNTVKHFQIHYDGQRYSFGQALFWSPFQIWAHLKEKPVLECDEGVKVQLLRPYINERKISTSGEETDSKYSTVGRHYVPEEIQISPKTTLKRSHTNGGSGSTIMTSMEGQLYKKKEGKKWKRRWCVLKENYLSYKKGKNAKPLKELDLHNALEIKDDYTEPDKENCFRIVFPDIYYIFSSDLLADKDVWFENIQRQVDATV